MIPVCMNTLVMRQSGLLPTAGHDVRHFVQLRSIWQSKTGLLAIPVTIISSISPAVYPSVCLLYASIVDSRTGSAVFNTFHEFHFLHDESFCPHRGALLDNPSGIRYNGR